MGYGCGFDIYPRLEATASNKETYRQFLDKIISTYENVYDETARSTAPTTDGKVLSLPSTAQQSDKPYVQFLNKNYIQFIVGECPQMPASPDRCDYFLRFDSKISGHLTRCAEPYIRRVYRIAKDYFGTRVHF
jgi:hypothetical protein